MLVKALGTPTITPNSHTLVQILDHAVPAMPPGSVLAITSKIVSLCEGSVVPVKGTDKRRLVQAESNYFLPSTASKWGIQFTITNDTLIPNAGIDESNVGNVYALWPKDAQATANSVRAYLAKRFGHKELAVIITDSTCRPMRLGVSGIAMAFSGIKPLRDYVGQPDLFDRPFKVAQADIVGGLASTAVLVMGEGNESTPLAMMSDVSFADFVDRNPTSEELASLMIDRDEDLFGPFLNSVSWQKGGRG